jgi:hypothetical protein
MKDFKFLKNNTWYNPDQQITYNDVRTINTNEVMMNELINASMELRESIRVLEEQTINLRDAVNGHIYGSDLN